MKVELKKIRDQVIVITGATSGIGLAFARKAAKRGARLVLVARNENALMQVAAELNGRGTETMYVVADVGNEEEVNRIADTAIARFERIDTWVNNAGVSIFGRNEEVSTADKRKLFDTNFWGVVYGSLVAVRHLKANGGALINIGSGFSDRAAPVQGIYSASKHAVKGFTDALRMELEEEGAPVSVTLVKPASVGSMLVSHAKNYLEVEPRLPPPIYAPEIAADAILYAAEHPTRDIYAGGAARLLGMGAFYMPRVLDWGMARLMFRLQKTSRPPLPREQHNLYTASDDLLERGHMSGYIRKTSLYTAAVTHPRTAASVVLGIGLMLAAYRRARPDARKSH